MEIPYCVSLTTIALAENLLAWYSADYFKVQHEVQQNCTFKGNHGAGEEGKGKII